MRITKLRRRTILIACLPCLLNLFSADSFGMESKLRQNNKFDNLLALNESEQPEPKLNLEQTLSTIEKFDDSIILDYERLFIVYQKALRTNGQKQAFRRIGQIIHRIDVQKKMQKVWHPPHSAKSYQVKVHFCINKSGYPENITIVKSSGQAALDKLSKEAVKSAAPYLVSVILPIKMNFNFDYNVLEDEYYSAKLNLIKQLITDSTNPNDTNSLKSICESVLRGSEPSMEKTFTKFKQALTKENLDSNSQKEIYKFGSDQLNKGNLSIAVVTLAEAMRLDQSPKLLKPISNKLLLAFERKINEISELNKAKKAAISQLEKVSYKLPPIPLPKLRRDFSLEQIEAKAPVKISNLPPMPDSIELPDSATTKLNAANMDNAERSLNIDLKIEKDDIDSQVPGSLKLDSALKQQLKNLQIQKYDNQSRKRLSIVLYQQGQLFLSNNKEIEAMRKFCEALYIVPDNKPAIEQIKNLLSKNDNSSNKSDSMFKQSVLFFSNKDYPAAIGLAQLYARSSDNGPGYALLGYMYFQNKQKVQGYNSLRLALQRSWPVDSNSVMADMHADLGSILKNVSFLAIRMNRKKAFYKRLLNASIEYKRALEFNKNCKSAIDGLITVSKKAQQYNNSINNNLMIAAAYSLKGNKETALKFFESAKKQNPDNALVKKATEFYNKQKQL